MLTIFHIKITDLNKIYILLYITFPSRTGEYPALQLVLLTTYFVLAYLPCLCTDPWADILKGRARVPRFSTFRIIPPLANMASAERRKVDVRSG